LIEALHVPVGLGSPVYDRLDADIAYAMMGINAVKAVEIGDGVRVAAMRGTENADEITPDGFLSNHAGGILGGISSGQTLVTKIAIKPTPSITTPLKTINDRNEATVVVTKGRHDPCVGIRAVPVAEAMMALTLIDHYLMSMKK
jgi:chorismate synthase